MTTATLTLCGCGCCQASFAAGLCEIERLRAENAALRERIDAAVAAEREEHHRAALPQMSGRHPEGSGTGKGVEGWPSSHTSRASAPSVGSLLRW
jgi:hypothetical protein